MYIDINRYPDTTTIKELKEIEEKERQQKKLEERAYFDFLNSYSNKYIFCNHNGKYGFVCFLEEDWFTKQTEVIEITPKCVFRDIKRINPYWIKSEKQGSVDYIKVITKEQYDRVEDLLKMYQDMIESKIKPLLEEYANI